MRVATVQVFDPMVVPMLLLLKAAADGGPQVAASTPDGEPPWWWTVVDHAHLDASIALALRCFALSLSLSLSFSLYLSLCEKSLEMKKRKKTVSAARNPKNVTMSLVKPVMNNIGAAGGTTAWAAAARATSAAGLPWRTGAARAAGCGEA